jgi:nitrate reductase molybdenum cofactor assembly chaperone NarJ/NarW
MTSLQTHQDICRQFAALLSYPTAEVQTTATACQNLLQENRPEAAAQLRDFVAHLTSTDPTSLEELFTATFDLQPACHPYVGYQLCGENQKRGLFLMKMQQLYREHDFNPGTELPDHLSEMLRFIGMTNDQVCRQELIGDGLLPALEKIIAGLDNAEHPYHGLLKALHSFLNADSAEKGALS